MIAALLAAVVAGAPPAPIVRLAPGTPIVLATVAPLSSRHAAKGDRIALILAEPISRSGAMLVAAGAPAVGEVTRVEAKGAFGAAGRVEAQLLYLLVDGRPVRIAGRVADQHRAATAAAVATGIAAGPMAFFVTGRSADIPAGTRIDAEVVSDTALPR